MQPPTFRPLTDLALRLAIAIALLIPCVWQTRIHAGDLSSHVYNAWLVREIHSGAIAVNGITVVPMWTNILTDWELEWLIGATDLATAQVIVVASAVQVFFWGAFFLLQTVSSRRPWLLCPTLAVLAYGLILHFGFLNFYLSTGLCFWILALLWTPSIRSALIAVPLIVLAMLAHVVPLVWAASVLTYLHLARRLPSKRQFLLPISGLAALLLLRLIVNQLIHRWSWSQLAGITGFGGITGVDQSRLYDVKYAIVTGVLLLLFSALFLERLDQGNFFTDPHVQIWLLNLFAFVLLPEVIQLPQHHQPLAYIPQRISLWIAILFCIVVSGARYGRGITRLSALMATVFFVFLYIDGRAFSRVEDEVTRLVETLPPGQRVVAAIDNPGSRLDPMIHVMDRACIARCFSYGDYEPATGQFRIRVDGPNPIVAATMPVLREIEAGNHIVTPAEAPLYSICSCENDAGPFCLRRLEAGDKTCPVLLNEKGSEPNSKPPAPRTNN